MNPYGKQKSRNSSLQRIYSFENGKNGGLGPGFFIKKFITNTPINPINRINVVNIVKKKYDLSIHVIFSNLTNLRNDVVNLLKNSVYNLNIQTHLINETNINSVKTNIKSDENRRFLIVDSTTLQHFSNLNIPFYIYHSDNVNVNNKLLSIIQSVLFYKTEEKI